MVSNIYEGFLAQPCPTPVIYTALICPVIIAYLLHRPDTRTLRIGVWLLSFVCVAWTVWRVEAGPCECDEAHSEDTALILSGQYENRQRHSEFLVSVLPLIPAFCGLTTQIPLVSTPAHQYTKSNMSAEHQRSPLGLGELCSGVPSPSTNSSFS
jgi:hypothetical protein